MNSLYETLKILSGGAEVLTTKQLAQCLSMNDKVISRKRVDGSFPIRHKLIGGKKVVYPILSVVKYLTEDEEQEHKNNVNINKIEPIKRRASNKATLPDLSKKMIVRGLLSALKSHQESIQYSIKELSILENFIDVSESLSKK